MEDKLSPKYNDAVQQIKTAILKSQARALAVVNQEQLALYYGIGRYISNNSRAGFWGALNFRELIILPQKSPRGTKNRRNAPA